MIKRKRLRKWIKNRGLNPSPYWPLIILLSSHIVVLYFILGCPIYSPLWKVVRHNVNNFSNLPFNWFEKSIPFLFERQCIKWVSLKSWINNMGWREYDFFLRLYVFSLFIFSCHFYVRGNFMNEKWRNEWYTETPWAKTNFITGIGGFIVMGEYLLRVLTPRSGDTTVARKRY